MSVLNLNPKVLEEPKEAVSAFDNLEAEPGKRECTAQTIASGESAVLTRTEQAKQAFLDGILEIPGAVAYTYGGHTLAEQAIRVVVPDILGETADAVYALQVRIRRLYRNIRLSVEVEEADSDDKAASQSLKKPE